MRNHLIHLFFFLVGAGWFLGCSAIAQQWPTHPLRIIVPWPPGNGADILMRLIAERLSLVLGQQVVVDNRAGAGGIVGAAIAAKASPDGYTYFAGGSGTLAIAPHLYRNVGYDALRDFSSVTQLVTMPYVFVISPHLPALNLKEFILLAKRRPGEFNYASSGNGSTQHLATATLADRAGITLIHVSYKGTVQSLTDVIGGQVMLIAAAPAGVLSYISAKKVRPIATSMLTRIPQLPDCPTVDEQGLPGYNLTTWTSLVAPSGTPVAILNRLNGEVTKIIAQPDVRRRLIEMGFIPVGNSREQLESFLAEEYANWAKIVQISGAKVE